MSKGVVGLLTAAATVAVAVFAPEVLPALIPGISSLGIAAGTAALELGVGLVGGALVGRPKTPTLQGNLSRLSVTMDPTAPRKIVFGGPTAGLATVRFR